MEEKIEKALTKYYLEKERPAITDVQVLDESNGVVCLRWRDNQSTITVKYFVLDGEEIILELK
jgi:hypothetical protein